MTPIENTNEAEWDAFHEWLDEWAGENKLNPGQARRLIESSPDMLEALKAFVLDYDMVTNHMIDRANEAIAKAEGK